MSNYIKLDVLDKVQLGQVEPSEVIEEATKEVLEALMIGCKYNQVRAAKKLGISRTTLRTMLVKYFNDKYVGTLKDRSR